MQVLLGHVRPRLTQKKARSGLRIMHTKVNTMRRKSMTRGTKKKPQMSSPKNESGSVWGAAKSCVVRLKIPPSVIAFQKQQSYVTL